MPNILKPFLCILINGSLALLLLFVLKMPLVVVLIISFAGFALSFYAVPNFGASEEGEDKTGGWGLFCWFALLTTIIVPASFICLEFSKYNFRGKTAEDVPVNEIEKYADYDYFYFREIKPLQEFTERLCKTVKSGKTGSSTICYNVFPVTDNKDNGVYKVWAVYGDYDSKDEFQTARSGIRFNDDYDKYLETTQKASQRFGIKSVENPVFITLTSDANEKIKESIRLMILAFAICFLIGTAAKGHLMYLSRKAFLRDSSK